MEENHMQSISIYGALAALLFAPSAFSAAQSLYVDAAGYSEAWQKSLRIAFPMS